MKRQNQKRKFLQLKNMQEMEFRKWLSDNRVSRKMQTDFVSRIKRIERGLEIFDIDEEYKKDKCERLLKYLSCGCKENLYERKLELSGTSKQYSVLKYAVKKYICFLEH